MFKQILLFFFFFLCIQTEAKIVKIIIDKNEPYANNKSFGDIGQYEKLTGRAFGEINPFDRHNALIQDIQLAPKNANGMVEYVTEFILLRPKDLGKSNGLFFLNLPNRGNAFPADNALLERGYLYFWCAWQGDVLAGNNRLTIKVPIATNNGTAITGKLRTEYHVSKTVPTLFLSSGAFTGNSHHSYETVSLDNEGLVLTKRVQESDLRIPIPNAEWAFADCNKVVFPGTPNSTMISIKSGFEPQYIYELIYTAKNPLVLGLGFAAIRDITSFLKHEAQDIEATANPFLSEQKTNLVKAAVMFGVSQCSGFTRTFLQLGFNEDENGKIVFEGVNSHIGPRRVSLNVRFGRPGGGGMQHEDHLFPGNEAPFTWGSSYDPISKIEGGILDRCMASNTCPKIMQTLSSTEYWQSRMSLRTIDLFRGKDILIPENVRIYLFSSTQHTPYSTKSPLSGFMTNGNSYYENLRALQIALGYWVLEGNEPPASIYPTLKKKTLVESNQKTSGWHDIPNVIYSGKLNDGVDLDFGENFIEKDESGIIQEPPVAFKKKYKILIPKVDIDNNEIDGIRSLSIRVPLGTYTGWSLRKSGFGEGDLNSLEGMFIPFKSTKTERIAVGDNRLSLEERYGSHEGYVSAIKKATEILIKERFLLVEDAQSEIEKAEKSTVLIR
ncbi:alpha/beta hydrolase domain-containing protein [Flavobacterium sp. XS2P39]|uniref:alpha/beta hydrolase domain-containing protein n=1 Tax=Flavobacterium sp. XS2P39 TaxID=3401725 RepID=UPI003AAD989C